jgi:hypothetical protein
MERKAMSLEIDIPVSVLRVYVDELCDSLILVADKRDLVMIKAGQIKELNYFIEQAVKGITRLQLAPESNMWDSITVDLIKGALNYFLSIPDQLHDRAAKDYLRAARLVLQQEKQEESFGRLPADWAARILAA